MNKSTNKIKLVLAPMAGITNKAFRQICTENGADITWSEMVSAEGLVRQSLNNNKSFILAEKYNQTEKKYWAQIFGNNPRSMAQAAKIIEQHINPIGIDINLGCPVKKAQKAGYGAIQIKNIPLVIEIIEAIKQEVSLPLSLKTRVGLSEPTEILKFAPKLEEAGIDQLVVHARTLKGMFHETPHWQIVKKLNETLNIPVIYNGGIKTKSDAIFYSQKTDCDTLMIGQAAFGNPWIFNEIKKDLLVSESQKLKTIIRHAELIQKYYGEHGFIIFRTHLAAYLKGYPGAKKLRYQAVQINTLSDVQAIVSSL